MMIYFTGAALTAFLAGTENITNASDLTGFQWMRVAFSSLGAGLIAIRAFIDQTIARNAPPSTSTPEKKSP